MPRLKKFFNPDSGAFCLGQYYILVMPKEKISFEEAIKELEHLVNKLEQDDLTLEEALQCFERGIHLMRVCEKHLKYAEGKIKELIKGENGELVEKILAKTAETFLSGDIADE